MANVNRGTAVSVNYQFTPMLQFIRTLRREGTELGPAAQIAHTILAQELQDYFAGELQQSIDKRGRVQRGETLQGAIKSADNRLVRRSGFTVGFLGDIEGVNLYYEGLEEGTSVHVGDVFRGAWVNAGGGFVPPTRSGAQIDPRIAGRYLGRVGAALQNRPVMRSGRAGRFTGHLIHIGKPIPAYHYFRKGLSAFRAENQPADIGGVYEAAFAGAGAPFFASFLRVNGRKPLAKEYKFNFTAHGPTRSARSALGLR